MSESMMGATIVQNHSTQEQEAKQIEAHGEQLRAYGLRGLEGRIVRGLDPAGMLAVKEVRQIVEKIASSAGVSMDAVDTLTKELHVGAIWSRAQDLGEGERPEVQLWMLLVRACHEVSDHDLDAKSYLADVERIKNELTAAFVGGEGVLLEATKSIHADAAIKFVLKDDVPFSESDAFLHMAIMGHGFGVCKSGELYFAGANELDYDSLTQEGLIPVEREDRGRLVTFYQRDGVDVVKKLYPGLAIILNGDEMLALRLAKCAKKFIA